MFEVAQAMGQIRQARLNIWIELQFWVDKIIVSDLDLGNPQHDAPGLDIAFSPGSPREKDQDTHLAPGWGGTVLWTEDNFVFGQIWKFRLCTLVA